MFTYYFYNPWCSCLNSVLLWWWPCSHFLIPSNPYLFVSWFSTGREHFFPPHLLTCSLIYVSIRCKHGKSKKLRDSRESGLSFAAVLIYLMPKRPHRRSREPLQCGSIFLKMAYHLLSLPVCTSRCSSSPGISWFPRKIVPFSGGWYSGTRSCQ